MNEISLKTKGEMVYLKREPKSQKLNINLKLEMQTKIQASLQHTKKALAEGKKRRMIFS